MPTTSNPGRRAIDPAGLGVAAAGNTTQNVTIIATP
jgi:hypothetical protein